MHADGLQLNSMVELLTQRAQQHGDRHLFTFLPDGEQEGDTLTMAVLDQKARAIAALLQGLGQAGDRVLMLYPSSLEFVIGYFGCLYAGMVAVPAYPPRKNHNLGRLSSIVTDCEPVAVLTTDKVQEVAEPLFAEQLADASVSWLTMEKIAWDQADQWQQPTLDRDTLAFLQYTSGSTGDPKGVMLTHGNLLYDLEMMRQAYVVDDKTVSVSWLPMFHDMGLIGAVLLPVYIASVAYIMPPAAFLQKPLRWLQAMDKYRGTAAASPNFGYDLCVTQTTDEQRQSLDLSAWTFAFSGAEPVRAETIEAFADGFSTCGFEKKAFLAGYGMAETTVLSNTGDVGQEPIYLDADAEALEKNTLQVAPSNATERQKRRLVDNGHAWLDGDLKIVNPETAEALADGQVGEIWVSGGHIAAGYWGREQESTETFGAHIVGVNDIGYLRTGDLGAIYQGGLYITGRLKDLIIIRGRNHYPQDIEYTVEKCHDAFKDNSCAVFTVAVDGEEQLVILPEIERSQRRSFDQDAAVAAVQKAVAEKHEVQVYGMAFLAPGQMKKTTSGKIQRRACREAYVNEQFKELGRWLNPRQAAVSATTASADGIGNTEVAVDIESLNQQLLTLKASGEQDQAAIAQYLRLWVAKKLVLPVDELDLAQPFAALGLDSVDAMTLLGELEEWLQRRIDTESLWDLDTLDALAEYLINTKEADAGDDGVIEGEDEGFL